MPQSRRLTAAVLFAASAVGLVAAADPGESAVVVDAAGKEIKLSGVKFTVGVRRLAWLADPSGATEDAKKGPWAFELREPNSTTYQKGVVTLVPLASVEKVDYDYAKFTTTVAVRGAKSPVVGTCQYKGFCFLGLEGDAGGVKAKMSGGAVKTGFKSAAFPGAKPLPPRAAAATTWAVTLEGSKPDDKPLEVRNLKPYYQLPGGVEQLSDSLPVRKGEAVSFGGAKPVGFKTFEVLAVDPNKKAAAVEVDGERLAVVLTGEVDKKPAVLAGLLGEVDAGWKFFPLHCVQKVEPGK